MATDMSVALQRVAGEPPAVHELGATPSDSLWQRRMRARQPADLAAAAAAVASPTRTPAARPAVPPPPAGAAALVAARGGPEPVRLSAVSAAVPPALLGPGGRPVSDVRPPDIRVVWSDERDSADHRRAAQSPRPARARCRRLPVRCAHRWHALPRLVGPATGSTDIAAQGGDLVAHARPALAHSSPAKPGAAGTVRQVGALLSRLAM
jgi:hypothetical protein